MKAFFAMIVFVVILAVAILIASGASILIFLTGRCLWSLLRKLYRSASPAVLSFASANAARWIGLRCLCVAMVPVASSLAGLPGVSVAGGIGVAILSGVMISLVSFWLLIMIVLFCLAQYQRYPLQIAFLGFATVMTICATLVITNGAGELVFLSIDGHLFEVRLFLVLTTLVRLSIDAVFIWGLSALPRNDAQIEALNAEAAHAKRDRDESERTESIEPLDR